MINRSVIVQVGSGLESLSAPNLDLRVSFETDTRIGLSMFYQEYIIQKGASSQRTEFETKSVKSESREFK